MSEKVLFTIPIYLYDQEEIDQRETLGIDEDEPLEKIMQAPLNTLYVDCYWTDPKENKNTRVKDIIFYINGANFRTPYSEKIIHEVLLPAMHAKAAIFKDDQKFITGPN